MLLVGRDVTEREAQHRDEVLALKKEVAALPVMLFARDSRVVVVTGRQNQVGRY